MSASPWRDAVTRATFAYAAVLFAVLFGPLVSVDPAQALAPGLLVFPDPWTPAIAAVALLAAAWQARRRAADGPRFLHVWLAGAVPAVYAGALYALAVLGFAPSVFALAGLPWAAAAASAVAVAVGGAAVAALWAWLFARGR